MKQIRTRQFKKVAAPQQVTLQGDGFSLVAMQWSNKGPLIIVTTQDGETRMLYDLDTKKWKQMG